MTQLKVNADNFAVAETHRMMAGLQRDAGGVNQFSHNREPAAIDTQTVIRMNRDTLYSFAVVDISAGATLTIEEFNGPYVVVAARTLVDPRDPNDLVAVSAVQDQFDISADPVGLSSCPRTRQGASTAFAAHCSVWLLSRCRSSVASVGRKTSTLCTT